MNEKKLFVCSPMSFSRGGCEIMSSACGYDKVAHPLMNRINRRMHYDILNVNTLLNVQHSII